MFQLFTKNIIIRSKKTYLISLLCVFFMVPFFSYSSAQEPLKFPEIIEQIESLQKDDLLTAIKLASFYDKDITQFNLEERIRFKRLQAELYNNKTAFDLAKVAAEEGLELTKKLSHPSINMAKLLNSRGYAIESEGYYDLALQDYIAALEIAKSLDDRKVVIETLTNLGAVYYITEKFQRSIIVLNDALSQAQILNDNKMLGLVYLELGALYSYLKQEDKVQEFNKKAYSHLTKANEPHKALMSLQNIAVTHAAHKEYLLAIELYKDIIGKAKKSGNFSILSNSYSEMAEAYLKKEPSDPHTAYHYILIAEKYAKSVKEANYETLLLVNKADILNHLERYQEALAIINRAEKLVPVQAENIQTYSILELLRIKSELYYAQGLYEKAYNTQNERHTNTRNINSRNNLKALEGIRIQYESKQEELQAKALKEKQVAQSLALQKANEVYRNKTFYIFIGVITVLALAWFYIINLNNQKKLLNSRETDHLTDLPNRQTLLALGSAQFNQVTKNKADYSVLIIKVDNFTNINQVKGYDIGNSILIEISLIITNIIGENTQCGRYSSNEFIVLLPNVNAQIAEDIAYNIHSYIYRKSWEKYGLKVISVSIGMSNNNSYLIQSYESLVKQAGVLKQKAVVSGGNMVCV